VDIEIRLQDGDNLRSLRGWLIGEDELRGRVRLVESPPPPGALGMLPELLVVTLAQGDITALATVLITWLRQRRGELAIRVKHKDTEVEVSGKVVRGLDAEALQQEASRLAELIARADQDGENGSAKR